MKRIRHSGQSGGFSLVEAIVITIILSVLIALFLPALAKARKKSSRIGCTNCLKQVGLAYRMWAGDNGDKYPMRVSVTNGGTMELVGSSNVFVNFLVMSNELSTPKILLCPEDKKRMPASSFTTNFSDANVSYFVGVDADETNSTMFLSGDDHLAVVGVPMKRGLLQLWTNGPVAWKAGRHSYGGNIGLVDGSVQSGTTARLRLLLQQTGVATNRLAMP